MLVLSRNAGDGISFPDLDLVVEILKVQGKRVQLGVSAADTIRILRSELCEREKTANASCSSEKSHALRNELNSLSIGLSIAEKHLQRGDLASAEGTLENIFTQLKSKHLPSPSEPKPAAAEKSLASPHAEVVHTGVILIVEDNPNESQLLAEILGLNGFQVQTAMDGNQAMLWLETNTPDVILMDMHMAHCDGPTTIRRIREVERLRSIPIFAVTGASREEIQAENCGEFEVQDWFQKPVKSQPLMHAIDDLVTQAMRF